MKHKLITIDDETWNFSLSEDKLFYLDPHICHPFVDVGRDGCDASYHSNEILSVELVQLDPSIAVVSV